MNTSTTDPGDLLLTRQQRRDRTTRALAAAARTRSDSRREQLLAYVVGINMGVARSVAGRYINRGIEQDDLVQVAYAALTRAARDFDPTRRQDFLSYAVPSIRGELKKHFRDLGWTIRPPRRVQEAQARITRAEADLLQRYGRSPRPSEIADHIGLDLDHVIEAMATNGCFAPSSLDQPLTGADGSATGSGTAADLLGEDDSAQAAVEARATLAPVVRRLRERDRRILYLRFFEERTQQEIADDIGVTQMQVSRLLSRIMQDLRTELADESASAGNFGPSRAS